jgi:hypothetical protein
MDGMGSSGLFRATSRHLQCSKFPHSITSSARAISIGGTSIPIALVVFRLTTNEASGASTPSKAKGHAPARRIPHEKTEQPKKNKRRRAG